MYALLNIKHNVNGTVTLYAPCFVTGKHYEVTVPADELQTYLDGQLAQKAFPNLSPAQREFIISGTSPEGWDLLFPPEDNISRGRGNGN